MKLVNTALGLVEAKWLGRPFYARFHVTYRCDYLCRMCRFHGNGGAGAAAELTTAQVATVADRVAEIGPRHVVLTGGEPFLRADLPEIVAAFARRGFSVRVQTNGGPQVTRERLAACAAAGLRDVSVSVDTLNPALQDEICGTRDALDNAMRALRLASEILPHGISQANVVASGHNFRELPELVRRFRGMGIYTYITPVMIAAGADAGGDYLFRGGDPSFGTEAIPLSVRKQVTEELLEMRKRRMGLTNSTRFLRDYREYLVSGRNHWQCEVGTLTLDVLPDGGVAACKEKRQIGNILDPGFARLYRSGGFREQAMAARKDCAGCFYGEYREPLYAVRDAAVFREWVRDWWSMFRHGMRFRGPSAEPER